MAGSSQSSSGKISALSQIGDQLRIEVSNSTVAQDESHKLLLSFQFGTDASAETNPAVINTDLLPLGQSPIFENWWYKGKVDHRVLGRVAISECDQYTVATFRHYDADADNFREFTRDAYRELLAAVRSTRNTQIVKVWNYLGGINNGDEDDERYRQFSVGRAEAFAELNMQDDEAPTGTAIGTKNEHGLILIALASNEPLTLAENPRQISAFHYPRQYGLRSPKFSRAGFVSSEEHTLFLISGTAAVVGHESAHPYDTDMQIDETLVNLDSLCAALASNAHDIEALHLDNDSVLRVYVRDGNDVETIGNAIQAKLSIDPSRMIFLSGNICRRELMVEIDGVKVT